MKKILLTVMFSGFGLLHAQVIIGGTTGTTSNKTSVLLEFAQGQNKGIILPYVRTVPQSPTPGTLLLDASAPDNARVKYYKGGTSPAYVDLSGQGANVTSVLATQPTATEVTEAANSRTVISTEPYSPSGVPEGVLVLNSASRAMVLPTVADVQDIPRPSPGMMVYVNKSGAKRLAVFNGSKWSFWQPAN